VQRREEVGITPGTAGDATIAHCYAYANGISSNQDHCPNSSRNARATFKHVLTYMRTNIHT
jgi:hypothetical protein